MSMPSTVRQMNEARVLRCLLENGPMTRADLARSLSLMRSTVGNLVMSLTALSHVIEVDGPVTDAPIRTGRPGTYVSLNPQFGLFLGLDISAQYLRLCAVDLLGEVQHIQTLPVDHAAHTPEHIVEQVGGMLDRLVAQLPDQSIIQGLNVAVPGIVDLHGTVLRAPPLNWRVVALRDMLQTRLPDIEVKGLVNDADAFAFADWQKQRALGLSDVVYMYLHEGVGGCCICAGQLISGANGFAGEIGHIRVGDGGFCKLTGVDGALENFISRQAVLQRYRDIGGAAHDLTAFLDALARNAPNAQQVLTEWARYTGIGISILTTILNPQKVILGGPVALLLPHAAGQIETHLRQLLLPGAVLPAVEMSALGPGTPTIGAALMLHAAYVDRFGA